MIRTAPLEPVRWSPRRWLYTIALVFLAQVILILFLAESPHQVPRKPRFSTAINLAVDPWSEQQLAQLPLLNDPTLFALPHLDGFSGAAWLTFAPQEHPFTGWTNSGHWLELDTSSLGKLFLAFAATNHSPALLMANEPLPPLLAATPTLTNQAPAARSVLRIEGDLARRPLLTPIVLPPWPHWDILTNTVVQLLVGAEGDAFPVTLLSSCGTNTADQFALKIAANAHFQPLRKQSGAAASAAEVTWGKMIFQWHTLPVPPTNLHSATP